MGQEYMVGSAIRVFIMSIAAAVIGCTVAKTMLEARKNICFFAAGILLKNIVVSIIMNIFFADVLRNSTLGVVLILGVNVIFAIINYSIFIYTFQCTWIQVIMVLWIGEIIQAAFLLITMFIVNTLRGEFGSTFLTGFFRWQDFLILPLMLGTFGIFYRWTAPYFRKFRCYQIRHKWFWYIVFFMYFGCGLLSNVIDMRNGLTSVFYGVIMFYFGIILITSIIVLMQYFKRQSMQKSLYLLKQELMMNQIENIHLQKDIMKEYKLVMQQQMAYIQDLSAENIKNLHIELYLKKYMQQLRDEYDRIMHGMYCDLWILDAYLCQKVLQYKEKGIEIQVSVQSLKLEKMKEDTLIEVLIMIFDEVEKHINDRKKQSILLVCGTVLNKVVIDFTYDGFGKIAGFKHHIMWLSKNNKGDVYCKYKNKKGTIRMMLDN